MKKWVKLLWVGVVFLFLSGTAQALPIAKFGKLLTSSQTMDGWLLTLLYDSDLAITLTTDDAVSFILYDVDAGQTLQDSTGSGSFEFSGLSSGTYYAQTSLGGEGVPQNPQNQTFTPLAEEDLPDVGENTNSTISFSVTPVPEPATILAFGTGLIFFASVIRRVRT